MIDIRATKAVYRKARLILACGFSALLLLVAGVGIYSAGIVNRLSSDEVARVAKRARRTDLLKDADKALSTATTAVRNCLASYDEATIQHQREAAHQAWADASVAIAGYAKIAGPSANLTARLRQELTKYLQSADSIIQLHDRRRDPIATGAFMSQLLPLQDRYSVTLAELLDFEWNELQTAAEASRVAAANARARVWLGVTSAATLALVIALLAFRYLARFEESVIAHYSEAAASAAELRSLSKRLFRSQEDERKRIAREIHDDFGQRMATMLYALSAVAECDEAAPELRAKIGNIRDELSGLARDIQNLSHGLHSAVLDKIGLEAAIRSDCSLVAKRTGIPIAFQSSRVPRHIPEEIALSMYRVYQEATQNALKHSHSGRMDVFLGVGASGLTLRVRDYGGGFESSSIDGSGSLGLVSMRERLRMVSGYLAVSAAPGRGTQVEASVPLPSHQDARMEAAS